MCKNPILARSGRPGHGGRGVCVCKKRCGTWTKAEKRQNL